MKFKLSKAISIEIKNEYLFNWVEDTDRRYILTVEHGKKIIDFEVDMKKKTLKPLEAL